MDTTFEVQTTSDAVVSDQEVKIYVKEIGRSMWFNVVKGSTSVVFVTGYAERSIEYDLKTWKTTKLKNDHKIIWRTTDNFVLLLSEQTKTSKVLRTPRSYCSSQLRNAWRGKSGQSNRRFSSKASWGSLLPEAPSVEQAMRKRHSDKSSDSKIKKGTNDFQTERRTQIVRLLPDRSELQISQEANWKKKSPNQVDGILPVTKSRVICNGRCFDSRPSWWHSEKMKNMTSDPISQVYYLWYGGIKGDRTSMEKYGSDVAKLLPFVSRKCGHHVHESMMSDSHLLGVWTCHRRVGKLWSSGQVTSDKCLRIRFLRQSTDVLAEFLFFCTLSWTMLFRAVAFRIRESGRDDFMMEHLK